MFIFLDKKREKISKWLKNKTSIDFSDWGVLILFLLGLFLIFYLSKDVEMGDKMSVIVLWLTAVAILQYTKETYWLKQINQKQFKRERENSLRPIILRSGFIPSWEKVAFKIEDGVLKEGRLCARSRHQPF